MHAKNLAKIGNRKVYGYEVNAIQNWDEALKKWIKSI